MKSNHSEYMRKAWNAQHALLRRSLEKEQDLPKAKEIFTNHHAMVHSDQIHAGGIYSFQDEILQELTEKQLRCPLPGNVNSAIWILWHITRIEDATMNVLLMDTPEIFHSGQWQRKLNSPYTGTGNELTVMEISALSTSVNVQALLDYRRAVAIRTEEIVENLNAANLMGKPLAENLNRLVETKTVQGKAQWLLTYWGGHPKTNLLLMPATRHGFVHLNEIRRMLPKLQRFANNALS